MKCYVLLVRIMILVSLASFGPFTAIAQDHQSQREVVNSGTVGIMSGAIGGTDLRIAADLANAFDDGYDLRVLAIVGKGSVRDIEDLVYLRGIDVAIVQSDVLDFYKQHDLIKNIDDHVHYIAKLYDEEVHLLARKDIASVGDLAGKRVNFGPSDGGTYMTSGILFDRFDVEVDVAEYNHTEALQKLKAGEIDAMIMIEGKPVDLFETLAAEDGLHLVPLAAERVGGSYYGVPLSSADYPGLIAEGTIETIGVGEVLAAYKWPDGHAREVKLTRFVDQLFNDFDKLQSDPYHPKWRDVDLRADLPGWQRLPSARRWLNGS
ncbi:MAG: TAXI family TRAP transporter solute-binding subunit [Geminicoccaceae bacterium]